jgi:hypothetical protein
MSSASNGLKYIPTARAQYVIARFQSTINDSDMPRSWTLVGPYGSGKSSFGLFLTTLLGKPNAKSTKKAWEQIDELNPFLADNLKSSISKSDGLFPIVLTGRPEPFIDRFVAALKEAIIRQWPTKKPSFYKQINSWDSTPPISEIMEAMKSLQQHISDDKKTKYKGILIVVDELNKFLEYEARHQTASDIYLLQELAEYAHTGTTANIYIFTLSHQAFDQYASSLNKTQQEEWAKIQGRFENIPYIEPVEQTLRIVARAIECEDKPSKINGRIKKAVSIISCQKALPVGLVEDIAFDLFEKCYPLHPITALILPILCQKLAQNERTLFSFIGSPEPYGFQDSINRFFKNEQFIYPWTIYDYFVSNQSAAISDHFTHRRWAEVSSALERLGDASDDEINLLKTIGLINIIGAHGGLKASLELLKISTKLKPKQLVLTVKELQQKSLIQFRKFNDEYRVWQGSDFDIEEAVQIEMEQLHGLEVSANLNLRDALPHVVASRHSIEKGTFRYFTPFFTDEFTFFQRQSAQVPQITFYLTEDKEVSQAISNAKTHDLELISVCYNYSKVAEVVKEVIALKRVRTNRHELNSDPVALREYKDRLIAAKEKEDLVLQSFLSNPKECDWYWRGKQLDIKTQRSLKKQLSAILSDVFHSAPVIKNELINKDSPSAQAVTGRNKLIRAMLTNRKESELAIDKYPAEKAIYKATLQVTGIHKQTQKVWEISPPPKNFYNLRPAWDKVEEFLRSTDNQPRPFTDIDKELMAPPYGIKGGLLPVLYAAVFIYHRHEIALYEEGQYLPVLPPERYDVFIKRLDLFSVQLFRIDGVNRSLFEQYSRLFGKGGVERLNEITVPLASFMGSLPQYTMKTKLLSEITAKVRDSYADAQSPEDLFFKLLPKACGYEDFDGTSESLEAFSTVFRESLKELRDTYGSLLDSLANEIGQAFLIEAKNIPELRSKIKHRFSNLENYTADIDSLRTFLRYLVLNKGTDHEWIEKTFSFLASKKCQLWQDQDRVKASYQLVKICRRVADLEKLRLADPDHNIANGKTAQTILLRTVDNKGTKDQVIQLDTDTKAKIKSIKQKLDNLFDSLEDDNLKLALLAIKADELLPNSENY